MGESRSHTSMTTTTTTAAAAAAMDCTWSGKLSGDMRKAIEELVRGRSFTDELRRVLGEPAGEDQRASAHDLLAKILSTFTDTLSILRSGESDEAASQIPGSTQMYSPGWDGRKSEGSADSGKSSTKDRRGCYKRRKTSESWMRITQNFHDDGYAWRKYGQKVILHAKHQRSYYRCTHKHDQGCLATKQVQMTEDDPPMFQTTYHGHHTCKSMMMKQSQMMLESGTGTGTGTGTSRDHHHSSIILSFESNDNQDICTSSPFFSSFPCIKREEEIAPSDDQEEVTHNDHDNNNKSSSSDYHLLSLPPHHHLTTTTFDSNGDVLSGVNSSCTDSTTDYNSFDGIIMDFDDVLMHFN